MSAGDSNRETYRELCRREGERIPLMARAWWIEAVSSSAGKEWGAVVVEDSDGQIIAAMPYQMTRKWGLGFMLMPQLTQLSNVWTACGTDRKEGVAKIVRRLKEKCREERVVMVQMAARMEDEEAEIFEREGFKGRKRISYRLQDLSDMAVVEKRFANDKRHKIKRAEKKGMELDMTIGAEGFYGLAERHYGQRGEAMMYSRKMLNALYDAGTENGCCQIFGAREKETGTLAAAIMIVADERVAYYLATAFAPENAKDGALEWLTRESIRWAAKRDLTFDFEGSEEERIALAFRHYGAEETRYWSGEWYANKIIEHAVGLLKRKRRRK